MRGRSNSSALLHSSSVGVASQTNITSSSDSFAAMTSSFPLSGSCSLSLEDSLDSEEEEEEEDEELLDSFRSSSSVGCSERLDYLNKNQSLNLNTFLLYGYNYETELEGF